MKINPREFRHEVEILGEQREPDGAGGWIKKPDAVIGIIRAKVRPLVSNEKYQAQQVKSTITHEFVMRYQPDLTAKNKLRFSGRVFELVGPPVNVDEKNRYTLCTCAEVIK